MGLHKTEAGTAERRIEVALEHAMDEVDQVLHLFSSASMEALREVVTARGHLQRAAHLIAKGD